jgi:hypothetical protein
VLLRNTTSDCVRFVPVVAMSGNSGEAVGQLCGGGTAPFGGRSPEVVLQQLVEHYVADHGGFAIWGNELVSLFLRTLTPGLRVRFPDGEGRRLFVLAHTRCRWTPATTVVLADRE